MIHIYATSILLLAIFVAPLRPHAANNDNPAFYECLPATSPIKVDGLLNETTWKNAEWSRPFADMVDGQAAHLETTCALVWDHRALYAAFKVREPDIRAGLTERDSPIYVENDVELFIAFDNAYYELEINALNTVYEVFWIWHDAMGPGTVYDRPEFDESKHPVLKINGIAGHVHPRGWRSGFLDWDWPGMTSAVTVNGTLNDSGDQDQGWTVEIALPWAGVKHLAPDTPAPPENGDVWLVDCSRFQHVEPSGIKRKRPYGWTWSKHGFFDSHMPETFTRVRFLHDTPGGAD